MEHVTVCICTNKRPRQLSNLLERLARQKTEGLFGISVSIVDNDTRLSAKPIIEGFLRACDFEIRYVHAPDKNLALLRNLSLSNSRGEYVAFIDDDEYPAEDWLLRLYKTLHKHRADGVLGPVVPDYLAPPPRWITRGKFCERRRFRTGSRLDWRQTRMGNALIRRSLFLDQANLFDLKFKLGAEDDALFCKLIEKGYVFVWCDEAIVYEEVPQERLTLSYLTRRSRLIGYMAYFYYKDERPAASNTLITLRSFAAYLSLLLSLPICKVWGYHHYARQMIRVHYHKAVVLTSLGTLKIEERDI